MSSDKSPFSSLDFEEKTTQKLAYYYIEAQNFIDKLINLRFKVIADAAPHWKAAKQTWHADPNRNTTAFPKYTIILGSMRAFYAKSDGFFEPMPTSTEGCVSLSNIYALFSANNGA